MKSDKNSIQNRQSSWVFWVGLNLFNICLALICKLSASFCQANTELQQKVSCVGQAHLASHSWSTILSTLIDLLSSYWWNSNHPVTVSIIVTHLQITGSCRFLFILYVPMISTRIYPTELLWLLFLGGDHIFCVYAYFFGSWCMCRQTQLFCLSF